MRLGGMSRMPHRMGGGASVAANVYAAMRDGRGTAYTKDDAAVANGELRAYSHAIARAQAHQARGAIQAIPELATDLLPEWEQRFGVTPAAGDSGDARRAVLAGIRAGNAQPTDDAVAAAVSAALGGEAVQVVPTLAPDAPGVWTTGAPMSTTLALVDSSGGSLLAGVHRVSIEAASPSAESHAIIASGTITLGSNGRSVTIPPVALPAAYDTLRLYASPAPGASGLALVGDIAPGVATPWNAYPTNPARPGLHHLAIVVSASTRADASRVAKVHAVLGPMLSAWTTYDLVTSADGGFVLDFSPLDKAAL